MDYDIIAFFVTERNFINQKRMRKLLSRYTKKDKEGFKWQDRNWIPTLIQDRVWKYTGFETIDGYLERRCRWATAQEMAQEIRTPYTVIKQILVYHRLTNKYIYSQVRK